MFVANDELVSPKCLQSRTGFTILSVSASYGYGTKEEIEKLSLLWVLSDICLALCGFLSTKPKQGVGLTFQYQTLHFTFRLPFCYFQLTVAIISLSVPVHVWHTVEVFFIQDQIEQMLGQLTYYCTEVRKRTYYIRSLRYCMLIFQTPINHSITWGNYEWLFV